MEKNEPAASLRRRRQALLRQLPPLKAILRGSLIERYKRCGKPGCKCADGPGHGPKYLSLGQLPGIAAANGLRPAGALRPNGRVPGQSSPYPRDPGGDLRDQPRTAA